MNGTIRGLLAACLTLTALAGCGGPSGRPKPGTAPTATTGMGAAEPGSGCSASPISDPVAGTGTDLATSHVGYTAAGGRLNFVLPGAARANYPELKAGAKTADPAGVYRRALAGGAVVYGHPLISVTVTNPTAGRLTISQLRAVNTRAQCLPAGTLVLLGEGGGDPADLSMDLDADLPVARVPGQSFIDRTGGITLEPGTSRVLRVDGVLARQARAFDLAMSYLTLTGPVTQLIEPEGGGPFRAAPSICPDQGDRPAVSDSEIAGFKAHHFTEVLRQGDSGTIESATGDDYVAACTTF